MAPILLETRSTFLNNNTNNNNLWQGLWSDIINAIRPTTTTPSSRTRRSTTTVNKQSFMDSKFQLEYVSFPRLAEEEKDHAGDDDEEDNQAEKMTTTTTTLNEAKIQPRKSCSSVGGSRRRLLGSPWMF
ncbi:predicted protein [Lichtheimia corymbifera JMRC:FSU:9682]|uniref:Uncharacterized protein n=1 Tax=Lichtheimia corymbifera JMRC:FSU:9682 TaxID=1263082 RepID=A0A068S9B4_9FUNG|nr:predicted protein [Lichtheimia corymbifera JMRC:FSU:9682]